MYEDDFNIKNLTTFKIGGSIKEVYFPESVSDICKILNNTSENLRVYGNLSNTLVSSYGYDGKVVLTTKTDNVQISENKVVADAGGKGPKLSQLVAQRGLSGFEFLIGFPSSIGGAVCMNASANSQAISDCFVSATCYSHREGVVKLSKDEMKFDYRTSRCQKEDLIVLQAEFELVEKNKDEIKKQMDKNLSFRKAHQPSLSLPNCGSVFKNPQGESAGRLLDSIGAKGMSVGGVKVWENHANFIVNFDNGTSMDVLSLMYKMQQAVKKEYNILLEPEIRYLGGNNKEENELCQLIYQKMQK